MHLLRALARRRLRTALTVLGVGISVFALVVLGALSERMRLQVANSTRYYGSYAWVVHRASFFGLGGQLPASLRGQLDAIPGVDHAAYRVIAPLDEKDLLSAEFWNMSALVGIDLDPGRCILREMHLLSGRQMEPGSRGEAVLGYAAAKRLKKNVGDTVEAQGHTLLVVGILDLIGTDPDQAVFTSIADAREVTGLGSDQVHFFALKLKPDADEPAVQAAIEGLPGSRLRAIMPSALKGQISTTTMLLNSILYGCSLIAAIIGTLGIVNTLVMSVSERAREIATKRVIGATTGDIFREFLAESFLVANLGAAVGIGLGWVATIALNHNLESHGLPLFVVTGRLLLTAVAMAWVVGGFAGVFPALRAARLDPVQILRSV